MALNYIIPRIAIFLALCIIWLSINGRLYVEAQSLSQNSSITLAAENTTEVTGVDETRPVNLMIIDDGINKVAQKSVLNSVNKMKDKNPNMIGRITRITIDGQDPKEDLNRVCEIWDTMIAEEPTQVPDLVLDTTRSGYAAETVSSFTAALGLPLLSAQFDREADMKNRRDPVTDQYKYLVHVMAPTDVMPEGVRQLVHQMNISNAGVIFDKDFIMEHKYKSLFLNVTTRYLIVPMKQTVTEVRRLLEQFRELDIVNFFILGGENTVKLALDVGQSLNFTGPHYGWYALTEDNFEPRCNCRNLSLIIFKPVMNEASLQRLHTLQASELITKPLLTSAFYYDLARLGVSAMKISIMNRKWPANPIHLTCADFDGKNTPSREFDYYKELVAASTESDFHPAFAGITWRGKNSRNWAKFDMMANMVKIVAGNPKSSESLGIWPAGLDSYFQVKNEAVVSTHAGIIRYRITTLIKPPFVMYNPDTNVWSGYCIELIDRIASMLNFTYVIREADEKVVGMMDDSGNWTGMIKELHEKRADIALGALSVMADRASVVDFTIPYYDLVGFSVMMKKPKRETFLFKFLTVLSDEVWLCILGSYFITSIFLSIFNRWSPRSYRNNLELFKDDDEKRDFTFRESLWFCMTSLTPQGGGIAPKNLSGRLLAAAWWLFGFIIIASYTANLSAFLTVSRLQTTTQSLQELSKQYTIGYAPIFGSEAYIYFKRMADIEQRFYNIWRDLSLSHTISELERSTLAVWEYPISYEFTKMFQSMTEFGFPENMTRVLERIRLVNNKTKEFAFVGDATDIKYLTLTNCDLIEVGSQFSRKPYALAVQKGSPLKEEINNVLRQLLNQRELQKLKTRWWDNNPKKVHCKEQEQQSDGISMPDIGGIFMVTFTGIGVAIFTLTFEYYWYRGRPKRKQKLVRIPSPKAEVENVSAINITPKLAKIAFEPNQLRSRF